ncbi:MAG: hypothetical protein EBZ17_06700 [Actinobacteria bacterium]|nr:hypothetical protein [Actinomycetota bacterium]
MAATTATTATTPASTLLGLAVTALVLCTIALRSGAGIADLGSRTAVADLRLGVSGGRASLACSPAALAAGGVVRGLFVGHKFRLSS